MMTALLAVNSGMLVWTYRSRQNVRREHETVTIAEIAKRIAKLKGISYGGECLIEDRPTCARYIIPDETIRSETALRLGIRNEEDFFGGIVPNELVSNKVVTHPLCH